jgi:hypothetical protein
MFGISGGELIIILVLFLPISLWVVIPVLGIRAAGRRRRQRRRAEAPLVLAALNAALALGALAYAALAAPTVSLLAAVGLALNTLWFVSAWRANRAATASAPILPL